MAVVRVFTSDSRLLRCVLASCWPNGRLHFYIYSQLRTQGLRGSLMELHGPLPWSPVKASASTAAFRQTARTSSPSPSPRSLSPVHRHMHADMSYSRKHPTSSNGPAEDPAASTHLSDVPHLILKVTDRPLTGDHLLLSFRAGPLHTAGHFGPMVLQRCLRDPIGHVSVGLREARFKHSSGFSKQPGLITPSLHFCIYAPPCVHTCHGCKCLHICTWSGISSSSAAEHRKEEAGNKRLKKCRVYWRYHISAAQNLSCGCLHCTSPERWLARKSGGQHSHRWTQYTL